MDMKRVVAPDAPVRIVLCPICQGSQLFCVDRFLTRQDQADIQRYKAAGYHILSKPLHKASHIQNCECSVEPSNDVSPKPATARKGGARLTLSLRRKVAAT